MNGGESNPIGWVILIAIGVAGALMFWKGSDYVEGSNSAVIFLFGRVLFEKSTPGWFWIPPLPFIWAEHVIGDERLITIESDKVTMFDLVKAHFRVNVRFTTKRRELKEGEGDPRRLPRGVIDERSAILTLTSINLHQFEAAVSSAVITAGEEALRQFRSTEIGDPKVLKKLKKAIETNLDKIGGSWGQDFVSIEIQELEVGKVSEAAEKRVAARIDADTRAEDFRGLERIVADIRREYGNTPDADRMVEVVTQRFLLESVPKGTNLTAVNLGSDGIAGALNALVGEKLGQANNRVRGKTAQARRRYGK